MDAENNMTTIIYLIGKPGTGKYTIAKYLAKQGYIICDNQLINNPVFALLKYDGFKNIPESAWHIIKKIRDNIFVCNDKIYCLGMTANFAGKRVDKFA